MDKRIEIVEMRAGDIKTGFGNPRKITQKKKQELERSLEMLGDFGVFVIDQDNNIIAGNQRLDIIKGKDPDTMLCCKKLFGYTEAELKAINIKDNTHAGEWDMDMLADWTSDLVIDLDVNDDAKKDVEERRIPDMAFTAALVKKSDLVREAVKKGDFKQALKIAKDFRINITKEDREKMSRAYECIVHPNFFKQIGMDIQSAIIAGEEVVTRLYGE